MEYCEMHLAEDSPLLEPGNGEVLRRVLNMFLKQGPVFVLKDEGGFMVKRNTEGETEDGNPKPALP
jgi:hypothetical protein